MTIYERGKNKGFLSICALVYFAVLALPCLALGAGHIGVGSGGFHASSGGFHASSGSFHVSRPFGQQTHLRVSRPAGQKTRFRVSRPFGQQAHLRGFHRRGFFRGDGFFFDGDGGVITVEQPEPAAIIQTEQPVRKGRYVQPRWVDGGFGVQVSEPGYWTEK
jgi:hypothetical protein